MKKKSTALLLCVNASYKVISPIYFDKDPQGLKRVDKWKCPIGPFFSFALISCGRIYMWENLLTEFSLICLVYEPAPLSTYFFHKNSINIKERCDSGSMYERMAYFNCILTENSYYRYCLYFFMICTTHISSLLIYY